MYGREGTADITYSYSRTYRQVGDEIEVTYSNEHYYVNDYLQREYTNRQYQQSGTNLSTETLGPMDMIYSVIRVIPAGDIDPDKIYSLTTRVEVTTKNDERYAVSDDAAWREPFSTFKGIGAPYLGTSTLTQWKFSQYQSMYSHPVMAGYVVDERVEFIGKIDESSPRRFDLLAPADETWTFDNTPELSWNPSSDAGSGIDNYKLYVGNSLDKVITDNTQTSENASELAAGAHTWYVVAVDYAGNERRSTSTWTINIENSTLLEDNLMENSTLENAPTGENVLEQDNTTVDNLAMENMMIQENIATDNLAVENTPTENSGTADNTLTQETTTTDNSTTDNTAVQDNTTDTSSTLSDATTQDNTTTDNSSTTESTSTQDNTSTTDTSTVSSTTSATEDESAESSTDNMTDTTSSATFESDTTTESTSGTSDVTTDGGTTPTTEETTNNTAPGNSDFGHSHKQG